jgi:hypothetical protein
MLLDVNVLELRLDEGACIVDNLNGLLVIAQDWYRRDQGNIQLLEQTTVFDQICSASS